MVIYLALFALGFYFGKWLGALGLVAIYYGFFHSRRSKPTSQTLPPQATSMAWAYDELGVPSSATQQTIQQARKKLLNRYHPDKLGKASDAEKHAAAEKVNEIQRAYAAIKQHKGF